MSKPFAVGDRVAVYDHLSFGPKRWTGLVTAVGEDFVYHHDYVVVACDDDGEGGGGKRRFHPKQCRRLVKKSPPRRVVILKTDVEKLVPGGDAEQVWACGPPCRRYMQGVQVTREELLALAKLWAKQYGEKDKGTYTFCNDMVGNVARAFLEADAENERLRQHFDTCSASQIVTLQLEVERLRNHASEYLDSVKGLNEDVVRLSVELAALKQSIQDAPVVYVNCEHESPVCDNAYWNRIRAAVPRDATHSARLVDIKILEKV